MARISLGVDSSGRPLVVDDRTLAKLRAAEAALGHKFAIVQGSYRGANGAAASADTHARGGVVDLRTWDLPFDTTPQEAVLELRKAGLVAWYRTQAQGFDPHIHAVDRGNPDLDPSAARQVTAWEQGRNGLASNGADDGPRVPIPLDPPVEDDMKPEDFDRIQKMIDASVERTVKAVLDAKIGADGETLKQAVRRASDTKQIALDVAKELGKAVQHGQRPPK